MSASVEQEDLDKCFTVFDGSSPEDVSHARQLWSSLSLLPPLESRVSALRQRREEKQRYAAMADQRREILTLLSRQREQRIQKELLSVGFKPMLKLGRENMFNLQKPPDSVTDEELVKQLQ
ncbi:hypothetical protein KUCAC02_007652 [Chaenocephalus aceratus]|uniref:Uncharacterized protein n=1 Tax=Chaenocephalus aceratus TaxID=36190 RepID=A0ACB9X6W5_CHAAC|nr:hypothetical protein KUCAC02_007652 [Chaenocephalus aceratus]